MPENEIRPADCHARARVIAAELELIRQETGRPADARVPLTVRDASPREVYFAAIALFRKADQLCLEQTGDDLDALIPATRAHDIRPVHVLAVLDAAHREVVQVRERLGITETVAPVAPDPARTPSDVFTAVVQANRQLNLLLERPFTPADVYQQLLLANRYAERLCARAGVTPPPAPAFERKKRPADVYRVLVSAVERLQRLAARDKLAMLSLPSGAADVGEVVPGDVYDLASLALAELVFLHGRAPDALAPQPFELHQPHRRLPAHCHQLARALDAQLALLGG